MYGSPPVPPAKDLNLPCQPIESDLLLRQRQEQQQRQMSSNLLRYRSAPSSLLGEVSEDFAPVRASSPETETMLARFLAPDLRREPSSGAATPCHGSPRFPPPAPQPSSSAQEGNEQQCRVVYSSAPQMAFQSQPQQVPIHSSPEISFQAAVGSSPAMEMEQMKNGNFGSASNLIRHSSSPAGLFSHLNVDNAYGSMMRGMGGLRNESGFMMDPANRSKGQISFSSRQNSVMSEICEMENEHMDGSSPKDGRSFIPGFPVASWDNSSYNSFSGLKKGRDGEEEKMTAGLSSYDPPNGEIRNHVSTLPQQFSLPKSSSDIATIEKFLQFQDAVPCKIRAKRGCATHPRSIAERVRRTRISERMKKLQDLVPNMDKQTNTADMLDLAVDYIKDLQKQVKALTESRASCSCSASRQKPY